jgi:signal transduction histidine kinase
MLSGMGSGLALLSTIRDLPAEERREAERALVPLARSGALGDLAADVAHDVANPLFGVLGLVDLLLHDAPPGSDDEERLRLLHRTTLELKETLQALLDFARPGAQAGPGDLAAAARSALSLVRHGPGHSLEVEECLPAAPELVACSEGLLEQAALHLLLAARDAGGTVSLAVDAGALRVAPAGAESLGLVAAARIAADHGGALEREGEAWRLRLPAA